MADSIKCPECHAEIPLSEVINHQIEEQLAARVAQGRAEDERRHKEALAAQAQELRVEFEGTKAEREAQLKERLEQKSSGELALLRAQVDEQKDDLKKFRERELGLLQEKEKLDKQKADLELEVARKLDTGRKKIAAEARETADEQHRLALREKEVEVEQMQKQIEDLRESVELARSGVRGEAQEREIEHVLRERFRADVIEPVKSGQRGADVLQTIRSPRGEACGTILWESKRARNWSPGWVGKLKHDQVEAKADVAVLVCDALPSNVRFMELHEGVWLVEFACVAAMAAALRECLIGVAQAHSIDLNRNTALDAIYDYLSSNEFGRRMSAAIDTFNDMRTDLHSERRVTEARWTKRAKQLDQLELNTAGMYGELQALMGAALPAVQTLELSPPVELREAS
jgi:hypothetical protein